MEEFYIIEKEKLLNLLEAKAMLTALKNGGVNNWEWYEESFEDYDEEYPEKEILKFKKVE